MNKKVNANEDDFEWTDTEIKRSVKINSLPKSLQSKIASRKARGPQKTPTEHGKRFADRFGFKTVA
jgi:hypothetical protein